MSNGKTDHVRVALQDQLETAFGECMEGDSFDLDEGELLFDDTRDDADSQQVMLYPRDAEGNTDLDHEQRRFHIQLTEITTGSDIGENDRPGVELMKIIEATAKSLGISELDLYEKHLPEIIESWQQH